MLNKHDLDNLKEKYRDFKFRLKYGEFDHTLIVSAVVCVYIMTATIIYLGVTR